jgi:hypothetical protein
MNGSELFIFVVGPSRSFVSVRTPVPFAGSHVSCRTQDFDDRLGRLVKG